jgi:hypothetical protein
MNKNNIKISLAVLLLLCTLHMPYGYYQFVRFIGMIGFAYLAYEANQSKKETEVLIYIGLVILFQPFFKISLGRTLWNLIDLAVAIGLIASTSKKKN